MEHPRQQATLHRNRILRTIIPRSEVLNQAQIVGQDIFAFAPKSKGADAYGQLAKEVREYGKAEPR